MKRKTAIRASALLILICLVLSPVGSYGISLGAMKLYSSHEERDSLMAEKGVEIEMPSGDGWYPFVMTFNADAGFQRFAGEDDLRLTIMYNFPEFDLKKGCSRLYDEGSEYYSSFYGAYCVSGDYGFTDDGALNPEEASLVPQYDYTELVIGDLGLPPEDRTFEWVPETAETQRELAGYSGWSMIDARMLVNGAAHRPKEFLRNYIQYGRPSYDTEEDFAVKEMRGRVYGRYFDEIDAGIFFYVIAADDKVLERCDREILQESVLKIPRDIRNTSG